MDIIDKWKEEAQIAFSEYRKRDCGNRVYTTDKVCRRAEYAIINAYLDFLHFTKGSRTASNHRKYVKLGDKQRKDELKLVVREWNLS